MKFEDLIKVSKTSENSKVVSYFDFKTKKDKKHKEEVICYLNGRAMTRDRLKNFNPGKKKKVKAKAKKKKYKN